MSTYWGYVCKSHEPNIESEHWFNRGDDVLRQLWERRVELVAWADVSWAIWEVPFPTVNDSVGPVLFLAEHRNCEVRLRNEYGDEEPLEPACDHAGIEHGAFSYTGICPQCGVCKFIGHGPGDDMSELGEAADRDRADTAFLVGCAHGRAMGAAEVLAQVAAIVRARGDGDFAPLLPKLRALTETTKENP